MKKKKGFTLIELLATIVILSIILIISVPKIIEVIEEARRNAFRESANLMGETAKIKYTSSSIVDLISDEEYIYENGELKEGSPELNFKGEKPKKGIIKQVKGKISFALVSKDGKYCAIKKEEEKTSKVYDIKGNFIEEDCKIDYEYKIRYYIKFDGNHGEVSKDKKRVTYQEEYGELATATREKHIFKGWYTSKTGGEKIEEETIVTKAEEHTLYAQWEELKYRVTFKNDDGTVLQTEILEVGSIPEYKGATPSKASTDEYTYTFSGWDKTVEAVLEDTEYTAKYNSEKNKYTVTFKNDDGTVLQTENLEYGTLPEYKGAAPSKASTAQYTYTFKGWNPSITNVTQDVQYTATYNAASNKVWSLKTDNNSNDSADVGDVICISTECFYVISNNGTYIRALAQYNLLVGRNYTAQYTSTEITNATGLQSSTAIGWHSDWGSSSPNIATVYFSESYYWGENTTIDMTNSNNNIKQYLESYRTKLINFGYTPLEVTLITKEEIESLIYDYIKSAGKTTLGYENITNFVPNWVYSTSYWTRSSLSGNNIRTYKVMSDGMLEHAAGLVDSGNSYICGVRPVIKISSSEISKISVN